MPGHQDDRSKVGMTRRTFPCRHIHAMNITAWCVGIGVLLMPSSAFAENVKVVVAEATYVMGDTDSLASAEEDVLLRAKRKAVEEAGVYIETATEDRETE